MIPSPMGVRNRFTPLRSLHPAEDDHRHVVVLRLAGRMPLHVFQHRLADSGRIGCHGGNPRAETFGRIPLALGVHGIGDAVAEQRQALSRRDRTSDRLVLGIRDDPQGEPMDLVADRVGRRALAAVYDG